MPWLAASWGVIVAASWHFCNHPASKLASERLRRAQIWPPLWLVPSRSSQDQGGFSLPVESPRGSSLARSGAVGVARCFWWRERGLAALTLSGIDKLSIHPNHGWQSHPHFGDSSSFGDFIDGKPRNLLPKIPFFGAGEINNSSRRN